MTEYIKYMQNLIWYINFAKGSNIRSSNLMKLICTFHNICLPTARHGKANMHLPYYEMSIKTEMKR